MTFWKCKQFTCPTTEPTPSHWLMKNLQGMTHMTGRVCEDTNSCSWETRRCMLENCNNLQAPGLRGGRSTTKTGKGCTKWFQVVSSGHWRASVWLLSSFWNDQYSLYWKGKPCFYLLKRLATVSCFRDEPFKFTQSFRKLNIPDPRSVQALGEECPH